MPNGSPPNCKYKFRKKMFTHKYFKPYYKNYKGHAFIIDHYHPEDESGSHVWLICTSDPSIKVNGYVHFDDLVPVENKDM